MGEPLNHEDKRTQLHERVIEKHKSGEGFKNISKSLHIPWSPVQSITKKWSMAAVNLPGVNVQEGN